MMPFFDDDEFFGDLLLMGAAGGGSVVQETATGNPVTFLTDLAKPLKSLLVNLLPVQSGSGDPSPQNIRPIVAWDGVKVFGGGKNIFPTENIIKAYVDSSGIVTSAIDNVLSDFIPYVYGSKITVYLNDNINGKLASFGVAFYDKNKNFITRNSQGDRTIPYTINGYSGNGFGYIRIWINRESGVSHTVEEFLSYGLYAQYGEDFTAYEPYKPITETDISFPSPVYGGTLDVVSGVLKVEWVKIDIDGSEAWTTVSGTSGGQKYYRFSIGDEGYIVSGELYCDTFKTVGITASTSNYGINAINSTSNHKAFIALRPDIEEITDSASLKVWLSEHNITAVYKLTTPQEITLTPEQIRALKGNNTIWSDANGNLTAVYLKKG